MFRDLLFAAKRGDKQAKEELLKIYKPLLLRYSMIGDRFNEDLFQEQCIMLLKCIEKFEIRD